jgi:hypothetical protein
MFAVLASPPDEEAGVADVTAERPKVSETIEEHEGATAHNKSAADLAQDGVPAPTAASAEATAATATVRASISSTEAPVPPAPPTVPPARQADLAYRQVLSMQEPPPMINRVEVPLQKTSVPERSSIESATLLAIARIAEPAAAEDSSTERNVARALATLSTVFRDRLSSAPEVRRGKQPATPISEPVEAHGGATALFEQHELAADDAASDDAVSADQAVVPAEQKLHDIDALSEREPATVTQAVLLPKSEVIREPEDRALSTDHILWQKEEGVSLTDPGRQPSATNFDEEPPDAGFNAPRVFDAEEEPFDAHASQDKYHDSFDQEEDEEPATTYPGVAPDQPVSTLKELLDDFALQEAPTMSEQPKVELQPTESPAVPKLTRDPTLDAFESWLKQWRAGQVT